MARPDLQSVALFLSAVFDQIQAAADRAKAEADKVSPGILDAYHADVSAKIAQLRAEVTPETVVRVALQEVVDSLRTGKSFIRHRPDELAG